MWLSRLRREVAAANAVVDVIQDSILEIRTIAYRREAFRSDVFPQADYQEQIRLIADALHTLIPALAPGTKYTPTLALQYTWDRRTDEQRRWLRHTLEISGVDISKFVTTRVATTEPGPPSPR
jgi:hypothetical protein